MLSSAERACEFVAERVRVAAGARWLQGRRDPPLACGAASPVVRLFAEKRLHKIETPVATALVAWADGLRDVELLERVPTAREVLALQARGARCVSLLADGADCGPHAGPLAFALHDLCHLEKFVDPEHHAGQVGFSRHVDRALDTDAWRRMESGFDDAWADDRDHVLADMNGSAVFLFAALKMKLKMAVRRREARRLWIAPPVGGPLRADEVRAFDDALEAMLDAFGFDDVERANARRVSTRRDDADAAMAVLRVFEQDGEKRSRA